MTYSIPTHLHIDWSGLCWKRCCHLPTRKLAVTAAWHTYPTIRSHRQHPLPGMFDYTPGNSIGRRKFSATMTLPPCVGATFDIYGLCMTNQSMLLLLVVRKRRRTTIIALTKATAKRLEGRMTVYTGIKR